MMPRVMVKSSKAARSAAKYNTRQASRPPLPNVQRHYHLRTVGDGRLPRVVLSQAKLVPRGVEVVADGPHVIARDGRDGVEIVVGVRGSACVPTGFHLPGAAVPMFCEGRLARSANRPHVARRSRRDSLEAVGESGGPGAGLNP